MRRSVRILAILPSLAFHCRRKRLLPPCQLGSPTSAKPALPTPTRRPCRRAAGGASLSCRFPKGADLHVHLSGAVYAETFIRDAGEDGLCVDPAALSFAKPPCVPPLVPAASSPETDPGQPGPLRPADQRLLHAQLCSHYRASAATTSSSPPLTASAAQQEPHRRMG